MNFSSEFIEDLVADSQLESGVYNRILKKCDNNYIMLAATLVKEGYISRKKWGKKIGDMIGVAYLPVGETYIDSNLLSIIPRDIAETHSVIALYEINGVVSVAMSDPHSMDDISIISEIIGKRVSPVFSFMDEIHNSITMNYATIDGLDAILKEVEKTLLHAKSISNDELTSLSQAKEIKNLLDMIIYLALQGRASDIHIEPKKHHLLLRFRHDGVLFNKAALPIEVHTPLVSRIKVLCQLDISEKRKPQDGRFEFSLPHAEIDLRVSILPALHGEKVVLRILGAGLFDKHLEFESLGFSEEIKQKVTDALKAPNGMLFVTGPTGSGKTTTLHCALNFINHPGLNVVTIEDPVEYERPNITQVAVHPKVGRDFPNVLRAILRQDPDVIMIGEIRDLDTAKIAANAALTGHMVLTSLHTNDSIQAVTRMIEMGVEHFVIAPSIVGVLGQRLVRKVCEHCKQSYTPNKSDLERYIDLEDVEELPSLYRGKGCDHCNGTGFSGRLAIHEYLGIDSKLRNCILRGTNYEEFFHMAMASDEYTHFYHDGFKKAFMGLTTIDEVVNSVTTMPQH